jgi:trehalose 6-phosphate phosphatase
VASVTARGGLVRQDGAMVCELRAPGGGKGEALAAFLREPPFAGRRPVMVGDDLTDEHGFAAAASAGGYGILVGPPRASAARYGLDDAEAVIGWLSASLTADAA